MRNVARQLGNMNRGGGGSCPPEEGGGGHSPALSIMLDAVPQARGVPMGDIVPAYHVHGRGVYPRKPGYLHDHPTGSGRPVDDPLSGRHPTLGERLHLGHQSPEPSEAGVVGIPSLPRHIIARWVWRIRERLLQLVAEDGVADRLVRALIWHPERPDPSRVAGLRPGFWIVRVWHLEASSWALDPWIRQVSRHARNSNIVILCTIIVTYVKK
jgi:hypothetical protein